LLSKSIESDPIDFDPIDFLTATYHWIANNLWIDSHVGQQLFVAQHSTVKIRISRDFFNAIRAF